MQRDDESTKSTIRISQEREKKKNDRYSLYWRSIYKQNYTIVRNSYANDLSQADGPRNEWINSVSNWRYGMSILILVIFLVVFIWLHLASHFFVICSM